MPAKILKFPGEKGGVKYRSKKPGLSPIDQRLHEMQDEYGNPRNRIWLAKKAGISYSCLTSYYNSCLPDSLKNIYLRRVMTILEIDENYLLGLPRKGSI